MRRLLRGDLEESQGCVSGYVSRVAAFAGIPADHIEKDYRVIEVSRGVSAMSIDLGCSIAFKGGTGLSKAHRLMQRFSDAASNAVARDAYEAVVLRNLVWPGAPRSCFAERCARSNDLRPLLQGISG